ncbi:MAG: hypothetical protein ACRDKJ_04700 [Actinomycetota bacterium]
MSSSTRRSRELTRTLAESRADFQQQLNEFQWQLTEFRGEVRESFAAVRGEIKSVARVQNWMLGLIVPLFAGTWGTVIAVVLKG